MYTSYRHLQSARCTLFSSQQQHEKSVRQLFQQEHWKRWNSGIQAWQTQTQLFFYEGKFETIYLQCSRSWNVAEMPLNGLFESKVRILVSEVLQGFLACCWFKRMLVRIELKNDNFQNLQEEWMVSEVRMSARSDLLFRCRSLQSQLNHPASPEKQPKLWSSVSEPLFSIFEG